MIKLLFFLALGYLAFRLIRSWFRVRYVLRTVRGIQEGVRSPGGFRTSSSGQEKDITDRVRAVK